VTDRQCVAVLYGGASPERDVSLVSGAHVVEALQSAAFDVRDVCIRTLDELVASLEGVDRVFNCLHGGAGEDGTVQLLLDVMGIPYAGSRAPACYQAMDKSVSKACFEARRIPTPAGRVLQEPSRLDSFVTSVLDTLSFPLIVKPVDGGSTLGVSVVRDQLSLQSACAELLDYPTLPIIETFIPGRELTVGILRLNGKDTPLPVVEIRLSEDVFDYASKYTDGVAEFLAPAPLDAESARVVQDTALEAHHALGCSGYSRVDIRLGDDGTPYVLEVNTLPGMTPLSDLPRAARVAGLSYEECVFAMLHTVPAGTVAS